MSIREREDMQSVKATIIMAAYNTEAYIEEAIDSILQQSYGNFELLIIDDASTDSTLNVIKKYKDPRIRLFKNKENLGQTKCLNIGLREATGKYILIMDSDDIAHQDRLKIQIDFMEQNPEIVAAGSWLKFFGKMNHVLQRDCEDEWIRARLIVGNVVANTTFVLRKSTLDIYGISYDETLRYAQDYNLIQKMSAYGKIANIPQVLIRYRTHEKQVSNSKREEQMRCAGVTIKSVLNDLHISLAEEEFELWFQFCFSNLNNVSDEKMEQISNIISKIEDNNKKLKLYNPEILFQVLEEKRSYMNVGNANKNLEEKFLLQVDVLEKWLKKKMEGRNLSEYFLAHNIKKIAIYGMAVLGKRLVDELKGTEIEIRYFLDNNKGAHYMKLERKNIDYKVDDVDAVVITPIQCYEEICRNLKVSDEIHMISLQEIMYEIW